MEFRPSALGFVVTASKATSVLSETEIHYLQSQERVVTEDVNAIRGLADDLASSTYIGPAQGTNTAFCRIHFTCYSDSQRVRFFTSIGNMVHIGSIIRTEDGHLFENSGIRLGALAPEMQSLRLRVLCRNNLRGLRSDLRWYLAERGEYPSASAWCDAVMQRYRSGGYSRSVADFKRRTDCPATPKDSRSDYAMNPHCKTGSPGDVVLLFETPPGWNQHGGPELFTFDNHDPRGGLLLLNDGTVKFIRNEEELHQLRWK